MSKDVQFTAVFTIDQDAADVVPKHDGLFLSEGGFSNDTINNYLQEAVQIFEGNPEALSDTHHLVRNIVASLKNAWATAECYGETIRIGVAEIPREQLSLKQGGTGVLTGDAIDGLVILSIDPGKRIRFHLDAPVVNPFQGNRYWRYDRPRPENLRYLSVTDVEIEDANGIHRFDLNNAKLAAYTGLKEKLVPVTGLSSVCSGGPAVKFRTDEAEILLTPEEVRRHLLGRLTPEEFGAICDAVGATWQLHDDFYDPETGISLCDPLDDEPKSLSPAPR